MTQAKVGTIAHTQDWAEAGAEKSGSPQRWKVLIGTFLTYFYDSYDLAILAVAMPVLIKELNVSLALGGFLHSATMIGAAVGSIVFGLIAENYGRRTAIIVSLLEFGLGTALIYFVSSWEGWMLLRFVTGIGIGGVWGPCVALLAQHWAPRYMARANSFMLSTFAVGWIVASLVGRVVLAVDWRLIFMLGATSILVAAMVVYLLPSDTQRANQARDKEGKIKKIGLGDIFAPQHRKYVLLATLQNACQMGGFWAASSWIPTFLVRERGLALPQMASFLLLMYIGMFVGYQVYGYIADRIGRRNAIALAFFMDCVTIPLYLLCHDLTLLLFFGPLMGMSIGAVFGLSGSFYAELFPDSIRALAGGFCFNVGRLGAVIAPFTVGYIGQTYGLQAGIVTSPVIFAIGLIVTMFLPETLKRQTA
jgi:MFS family permease